MLTAAADVIEAAARTLDPADPLEGAYSMFAPLLRAAAFLVRWADAVRAAEPDAGRFATAARQCVRDLRQRVANGSAGQASRALPAPFEPAAAAIEEIHAIEDVAVVVHDLLCVPLPVAIGRRVAVRADRELPGAFTKEMPDSDLQEPTPVAFLRFNWSGDEPKSGDGQLADALHNIQTLQPDIWYDLQLEVRLSRWPQGVVTIEFSPLHVEPPNSITVPTFRFVRPDARSAVGEDQPEVINAETPVELLGTGRIRVHGAHDLLARPLEISYVAAVVTDPESPSMTVDASTARPHSVPRIEVRGQRRLMIKCLDPRLTPITGFPDLDAHLIEVRGQARRFGMSDKELAPFFTLLTATARVAQQAISDAIYPGTWAEDDFQRDLRDRLRACHEIGAALEEHPHGGGGINDLSLLGIRLELKVDASVNLTVDDVVAHYGQQTAQYVAASGHRAGVLAALDTSEKVKAPGLVRNDVALRLVEPPAGNGIPILLGVVVIRGNLAKPSALSKGAIKTSQRRPAP